MKEEKFRIRDGFDGFARAVVAVLAACALVYLAVSLLFSRAVLELAPTERVRFLSDPMHIPLTAALLLVCLPLDRLLRRVDEKKLFLALSLVYLAVGGLLIVGARGYARADPQAVLYGAQLVNAGDYSWFAPGQYLDCYPNQLGLLTVERPLMLLAGGALGKATVALHLFNLLAMPAVYALICRSAALLAPTAKQLRRWLMLALFSFTPALAAILMPYGHVPGLLLYALSVYLFLLGRVRGRKRLWWTLSVLMAVAAVWLRNNFLIGVAALAAVQLMLCVREKDFRALAYAAILLVLSSQVVGVTAAAYRTLKTEAGGGGIPAAAWVDMGLTRDGDSWGWHNGSHRRLYANEAQSDPGIAREIAVRRIWERLGRFAEEPAEGLSFFHNKLRSGWCESTFGGVWAGPSMPKARRSMVLPVLTDLYAEGTAYTAHRMLGAAWLQIVYAFALINLVRRKKDALSWPELLPYIYFLGGFLFHFFWEMKSLYLYTYVLALAIPAVQGAQRAYRAATARRKR